MRKIIGIILLTIFCLAVFVPLIIISGFYEVLLITVVSLLLTAVLFGGLYLLEQND